MTLPVPPEMIAATVGQLAPLVATFLQGRKNAAAAATEAEFKTWLVEVAFNHLLEQSGEAFKAIVSLKASSTEKYDRFESLLLDIRTAVLGDDATSRWMKLPLIERNILQLGFDRAHETDMFDDHFNAPDLMARFGVEAETIRAAAAHLSELGWVRTHSGTGGWSLDCRPAGVAFAWAALDPVGRMQAELRLIAAMPDHRSTDRSGSVATAANVEPGLARVLLLEWAGQGLLEYKENSWPLSQCLVWKVSETLRRQVTKTQTNTAD